MISDQFNIPSGPVLGVHLTGQTLPVDGVQIQALNSLTINFDTNVYEQGFGPWQDGDVQLESVGQNSSTSVPLDPATFDSTGCIATIPVDATLGTGTYQIVLVGGGLSSYLASTDSSTNQPQ